MMIHLSMEAATPLIKSFFDHHRACVAAFLAQPDPWREESGFEEEIERERGSNQRERGRKKKETSFSDTELRRHQSSTRSYNMMLHSQSWIFLALMLLTCNNFNLVEAGSSDSERLRMLKKESESTRSKVVVISVKEFRAVVEATPRSYSLFVMFSADPSLCEPCAKMREQFKILSSDYSSLSSRKAAKAPAFFVEVKLSSSDVEFLGTYGIKHVPILHHFASGRTSYPRQLKEGTSDSFNLQEFGYSANAMKSFVNDRSGSKMQVIRGGYEIPFVQTVRQAMPYIFTVIGLASGVALYTGAYKSPMLWFGLVVLVYIFSVGGGHYSWIHNTPLVVVDKNGSFQYIAGGSRSQYVAEGFFVSFTCVCISGLVIAIQELPSFLSQKSAQSIVGLGMCSMTMCAIGALLAVYQMVSFHPYLPPHPSRIAVTFLFFICLHSNILTSQLVLPHHVTLSSTENATISPVQRNVSCIGSMLLAKEKKRVVKKKEKVFKHLNLGSLIF